MKLMTKKMTKKDKAFYQRWMIEQTINKHVLDWITVKGKDHLINGFVNECLDDLIDELEEKNALAYTYQVREKAS